jgi:hypothetical protein
MPVDSISELIATRRREYLEQLCGVDSTQFSRLAKECFELAELERKIKPRSERAAENLLRIVYDKDARSRLLAIVLAAVALFATQLTKSVVDLPALFDVISDDKMWKAIGFVAFLAALAYVVLFGMQLAFLQFLEMSGQWLVTLFGGKHHSRRALPYFIADLIRFHNPAPAGDAQAIAETQPQLAAIASSASADDGPSKRDESRPEHDALTKNLDASMAHL